MGQKIKKIQKVYQSTTQKLPTPRKSAFQLKNCGHSVEKRLIKRICPFPFLQILILGHPKMVSQIFEIGQPLELASYYSKSSNSSNGTGGINFVRSLIFFVLGIPCGDFQSKLAQQIEKKLFTPKKNKQEEQFCDVAF